MYPSPYPIIGAFVTGGLRLHVAGQNAAKPNPRVFVVGPLTEKVTLEPEPGSHAVGAVLHAGALPCFFDRHAAEFTDRVVDARDVWPGATVDRLLELLSPAIAPEDMISRFETWLGEVALHRQLPLAIPENLWDSPIKELAAMVGMSVRHYQRLVPKHYGVDSRHLRRFGRYLRAMRTMSTETVDLPALAHTATQSGYFDQAHMARDFQALLGSAPNHVRAEVKAVDGDRQPLEYPTERPNCPLDVLRELPDKMKDFGSKIFRRRRMRSG